MGSGGQQEVDGGGGGVGRGGGQRGDQQEQRMDGKSIIKPSTLYADYKTKQTKAEHNK